jgi:hypothetical protein
VARRGEEVTIYTYGPESNPAVFEVRKNLPRGSAFSRNSAATRRLTEMLTGMKQGEHLPVRIKDDDGTASKRISSNITSHCSVCGFSVRVKRQFEDEWSVTVIGLKKVSRYQTQLPSSEPVQHVPGTLAQGTEYEPVDEVPGGLDAFTED